MLKLINYPLIDKLVQSGQNILVLRAFDEIQYWNFSKFEPNTLGSEPIEFCKLTGINITEYVNRYTPATPATELLTNLTKLVEASEMVQVRFPKTMEWQQFTM